ncbi:MAG: Fe-S cluster assembly protein SufD [Bradymonadaceae bacterium]|nr:Fe-S cluster assembly protein SufD [Lujinxingiaceae bacterium]
MSVAINHEGRSAFVQQFLDALDAGQAGGPAWLTAYRKQCAQRLEALDVPTTRHEEWRFTKLRPLTDQRFGAAPVRLPDATELAEYRLPESAGSTLLFVNGHHVPELSSVLDLPAGVVVSTWKELGASDKLDSVREHVGQNRWFADDYFYGLNSAAFDDGVVILVPKNVVVEHPVHILNLSVAGEAAFATHPRNLIVAGESSELTVVEDYVSLDGQGVYFTNVVNEIAVGKNAHVEHVKVQRESTAAFHIARNLINLSSDSRYHSTAIALGAKLSRNDSYALFEGTNIDCTLDGLAYVDGDQVADTHSAIDHARPNSRSFQLHKCIADGKSQTVFNGKIFVRLDAQQTRSEQLNQNLLLSRRATVDTKPQLEILADDVVCSHGATVGQLEDEQLFYLESRGLDPLSAKNLLTYAFAAEVVEKIKVDSLKERLEQTIMERTSGNAH